jgi:hypothetical protein
MHLTRRQIVEGGLAAGVLGLASGSAMAAVGGIAPAAGPSPFRHAHPGQPIAVPQPVQVAQPRPMTVPAQPRMQLAASINPRIVAQARASFDRHRNWIRNTDVIGIVDFSKMSAERRFFLMDTNSGRVTEHLVSHGRGSDPGHTGFLQRFSNSHGSLASSEGGYVTNEYYTGKYGSSMRVRGLDWTNNNAESRAIVIHPAWYAEPSHLAQHGRLGRSEGCFALPYASLRETLGRLGPGHFLYASRA